MINIRTKTVGLVLILIAASLVGVGVATSSFDSSDSATGIESTFSGTDSSHVELMDCGGSSCPIPNSGNITG